MLVIKELFYFWILLLVVFVADIADGTEDEGYEYAEEFDDVWEYEEDEFEQAELTEEEQEVQLEAELELMESDTVLWMNATYAPLTYANGDDWRIVAGREKREENIAIVEYTLERDWGIYDRYSAIETIERLKENGHTKRFQELVSYWEGKPVGEDIRYESVEDMDEDTKARALIVKEMMDAGYASDYIKAWDLCRVNQLYADCYLLGYMTFEEAMDCSLENSKKLQKMYNSWEDMVNAYMMGYRFWSCDLEYSEFGPTAFRYMCYEDLRDMYDSPYDIDWNHYLEKTW